MADEPRDEGRRDTTGRGGETAGGSDGGGPGGDATGGHRATVIQLERPGAGPPGGGPRDGLSNGETAGAAGAAGSGSETPSGAVVVVDRRMRQRRVDVGREVGRRRMRRVAWALAVLAVVVDGAALLHLPMLDVSRIVVAGTHHTPAATVRWASGIETGDTLATLDEHGAERRIARLPWVAEADVVRQWPSTVRIEVTEREPAAVVYGAEGSPAAVVDRHARVLEIGGEVPFGLITVTGLEGALREGGRLPAAMEPALQLGVAVNERLPGAVVAVDSQLDATLAGGGIARFGSTDELEEKLVALDAVLSDVDLSGLAVLDLRVPSSPSVRRRG